MPYALHDLIMNYISINASDCLKFFVLHVTHTVVYLTLRLSETINPIIYIYGSQALRKGFKLRCAPIISYIYHDLLAGNPKIHIESKIRFLGGTKLVYKI